MFFTIRFNYRSYQVQLIDSDLNYITVRFGNGDVKSIRLDDWNRYQNNQKQHEEAQRNGETQDR